MTTLAQLSVGAAGKVVRVNQLDEVGVRLLEMGLTPGVEVEVLGVAPLGDPIELALRGYRLSVRRSEATRVDVEPASV